MKVVRVITPIFFLISLLYLPAEAAVNQYPGFSPVEDITAFKQTFIPASAKVKSVESDFVQEKELAALTEKITSHGKLWYKRESKVRMDYSDPFTYGIIINGNKMIIRDGQKESQINVKSSKLFRQLNRIMLDCMQGTILESPDFSTRVFENDSRYLLEFTTMDKSLKEFFQLIILIVEKGSFVPTSIQLNEPSGDKTLITLQGKTVNGRVSDEVFSF